MGTLLSILGSIGLTASVPAPLLANTTLTRVKRDVSPLTSNSNNDYLSLKKINGIKDEISVIAADSKDNVYFGTDNGAFKLLAGSDTPTKIDGIDGAKVIAADSKDNVYFGTDNGAFKLLAGSADTPTKINAINGYVYSLALDSKNNVYYGKSDGIYKLIAGSDRATKINGISEYINKVVVDSKDNIYFATSAGVFVLKQGSDTPTKINNLSGSINSLAVDNKDNVYFLDNYVFVLKQGSDIPTKIDEINYSKSIFIDNVNNIYIGTSNEAYKLIAGSDIPTKIDEINGFISSIVADNNRNIYFNLFKQGIFKLQSALSWVKTNVNFNLVDNTKNMMWLRNDQLVTNEQVKIEIANTNTNIETVKVNGKEMPQTNKVWEFDLPIDSTTVENKDYQIEITFKVDAKSYTGQIIVSSLLAQPSVTVQKNTSLFGKVDSYIYQVPTDDKVGGVTLTSDLYYSDTEVKVSLNKPTVSTTITAQIFGLDEKWEKNKNVYQIFDSQSYNLDGSQLKTYQGRYLIETEDNSKNKSSYYVVVNKDNLTPNFWDTEQGQQFYAWANLNGYNESIKKLNAIELNKKINESKNWQQLASDSQFATAVADWFKVNGKLSSKEPLAKEQVIAQLQKQIPKTIKIDWVNTSNFDINKVSFELNQSEFNPNDKVNIIVKYNNAQSEQFTLQIKDSNTSDNKKGGLSGLAIVGIVVGSLAGLALLGWLFKKFVVDPFILNPIRDKKQKAWRIREDKALAEIQAEEEAEKEKRGK